MKDVFRFFFFFQAEDGIRDLYVTGVQTCALPICFDLHSVREYQQGESLRMVHWRSTAKRGQLMVRELEDSPRDEVAVVLDADPVAVVGESFELQVRAAGSLLLAHARRGRRSVLV